MPDVDIAQVAKHLADLRMQVNALQVTAKTESLPNSLKEARTTVRWSALAIAAALILSSVIKVCGEDRRVEDLEKRIEVLEKHQSPSTSP